MACLSGIGYGTQTKFPPTPRLLVPARNTRKEESRRECAPRQLIGDRCLRFPQAMLFEPLGQLGIGDFGIFQLVLQERGGPFGPFLFGFDVHSGRVIGGEGKTAEVDGGYVKPANRKEDRLDRRFTCNQNGKRKVVVIVRERDGNSVPAVFNSESQAASFIRARPRPRPFTPTKPPLGITCTNVSR